MKVRELIAFLSEQPLDAQVVVLTYACGQDYNTELRGEDIQWFQDQVQIDARDN